MFLSYKYTIYSAKHKNIKLKLFIVLILNAGTWEKEDNKDGTL